MEGSSNSGSGTKIGVEDWEAFCEFLRNLQPPRSLSDCTANDVVEFLRGLPSDRLEAVVVNLSANTFKKMFGSHKENPFASSIVSTFLREFAEKDSKKEYGKKKLNPVPKEHTDNLFQVCLTTSDGVYLVIAKKDAEKYFPVPAVLGGTECVLQFEDEDGKPWMFKYSYQNVRQIYVLTQGWSRYVKEKKLGPGDFVFFQPHLKNSSRFFIGCRRRDDILREEFKEVETPLLQRFPKLNYPILVISCGDDQESEETYFISYILNELRLRSFTPCRYDLTKSTVTGIPAMLHRSRICIVIVSMNNARSQKSLDEFLAIMSHIKANKVALIPVYFKLSGDSSKSAQLGYSLQASQVQKWREAMSKLTVFNRYQYTKGDEVVLAKSIVRDVCSLLYSKTSRNLFGIKLLLRAISPLLHCPQPSAPLIVGLWGMAGIGKTTITREIFKLHAESYDFSYFLPDFYLMCEAKGLSHLRDIFFSEIFGEEKVFIDACDTNLSFKRDRFLDKSILVILDGVSNARDVEALVGGFGWFSSGHTIILTSRNKQVLVQCKAKELYEIPKLSESDSFRLCCQNVTEQNWNGKMSLISELVNYAGGNPLALRVLGSSVQIKCINNENEHLRRLRQHLPIQIQVAFRRSFNGLHDNEKKIFLDLACFFRGEKIYHVVNMLDGCGLFTDLGIYALVDESLISLVDNRIEMPNIFQDTGRFVVCQECEEAGKRSRLWDSNDIVDVLTNNSGTEVIEGIFLDASGLTFELSPTVFERMYRLRLLKLHCPTSENHFRIFLPQGLYSLPDELRLLHWERYPLGSLPRNFNPKNLVELNMPYSNLTKLWKGTKNLQKLKRIVLTHSQQLTKFPRLSKARNLEHIDLEGCTSLVKVNSSIIHHHKLTFLSLKGCSHLRIMPPTVHLESLEVLNLSGCSELENLQDFSPNLKELYLSGTAIREMPTSIGDLSRLVTLDLENCDRLQHLPLGISNLKSMVTLKLSGCSNLMSLPNLDALFLRESVPLKLHSAIQESRATLEVFLRAFEPPSSIAITQANWSWVRITFLPSSILQSLASRLYCLVSLCVCNAHVVEIPEDLCWLASVKTLDLGGNSFSQIPKSIKELRKLHSLGLRHCKNLRSLPELPRSLEILNAHGCVSLESFPPGFEQFPRHYTFSNCSNLSPEVVRECIIKFNIVLQAWPRGISWYPLYLCLSFLSHMHFQTLFLHMIFLASLEQEHRNIPAFSLCMPASAGHKFSVDFQAGSSVRTELTSRMLMSGFTLSVVVEFRDNYRNVAGFGIKCICRKTRTDLSPRLERNFYCWAPTEAPTIQKDHMFVFGSANMLPAEGDDHDVLADLVTFEFHPVDWQNKILDDSCAVKKCGVYLFTAARCDTTVTAKRPSSMDPGEPSSVEHMAPPFKRCQLKRGIESGILSLRKRKREKGVSILSTTRSLAERSRRTGIAGGLKKLQELVPNMEKQTSQEDMLDAAVDYIKDLENQYKEEITLKGLADSGSGTASFIKVVKSPVVRKLWKGIMKEETNEGVKVDEVMLMLQLKRILPLLSCSQSSAPHIVGLWGMAGIGKTAITKEIFRTQAERYDVCCFLPDFHLICQTKGLSHLRDEFFSKLFGEEKIFIDACDTKLSFTRDRLLDKRLLIVIDGVSNARDVEVLVGGFGWFSGGHTIILTSKNRQVLVQCKAKELYEIQKLSEPESFRLCCLFATEQNWKGRMSLFSELVNYASGNPLALRVLGSSIQNQCINDEKQHLRRLRQHPPIEIHDAFRRSFNGLDDNEKNTFLDLACFFRGENKDHVVNILDGCGFFTDLGIYALIDESLISLVDNRIEMPNIFQDTGRFVVCQEYEDAGKRSRLWDSNDIVDVLTNNSLSGCPNLKSYPTLDALLLQDSQGLNKTITIEESVPLKHHYAIEEARDAGEEVLRAFKYLSSNGITQESWTWVTITFMPSSILHSLASRLYSLVSLSLCNACLVDIPEELCWLPSVKKLDLGGNSFSQIPESIKELRKLHSLRLCHCKNLTSLPELPRSLGILNAHGCVSLKSFPSSFTMFSRHYTFSNCFALSPEVVRKYMRKALDNVEVMAKDNRQEHRNTFAFSVCVPASAGRRSSINFQAGSSVMRELTPGIIKTLSGFAFSVVVEFWDNYSNAAGFGIKCICRKPRTDLSPRLERIFQFWSPKEAPTVQKDHMFLFGFVKMNYAEEADLADLVKFEFHPVNAEYQPLDDSCTVKRCGVYLITAATCGTTIGAKRPDSCKDPLEHMAPPYKRCRLKGVIETVILSLRKRKLEKSVSTVKKRSKVDQNYRYLKHNEGKELGSHKFLRIETAPSQSSSSLTDSPTSIRKPAQSAARIQQVSRAQSFEKKLSKEFGDSKFGVSVSVLSPKTRKLGQSYSDVSVLDAAIRIQANFRGYKCRKQRLFTRQGTILIQARWRGYQARKNYQNLIMSMGILE